MSGRPQEHCILVLSTTVGSEAAAHALARGLVEHRLAACVQIDPNVTSLYRWQGELREDQEVRLVIKSTPGREAELRTFLAGHHPYELPQFLAMTVPASAEYALWVGEQVSTAGPPGAAGVPPKPAATDS